MTTNQIQKLKEMISEGDLIRNAEIILTNDGSKDNTLKIIKGYSQRYKDNATINIRVVDLVTNNGKGAAVKYVQIF